MADESPITKAIPIAHVERYGYVLLKGQPCRVSDTSFSRDGKHGHGKLTVVGNHIFTGKSKYH